MDPERRQDPDDGNWYTFQQVLDFWINDSTEEAIREYWDRIMLQSSAKQQRGVTFLIAKTASGSKCLFFGDYDGVEDDPEGSPHRQLAVKYNIDQKYIVAAGAVAFSCSGGKVRWSSGLANLGSSDKTRANDYLGRNAAKERRDLERMPGPWSTKDELNQLILGGLVRVAMMEGKKEGFFELLGSTEMWVELELVVSQARAQLNKALEDNMALRLLQIKAEVAPSPRPQSSPSQSSLHPGGSDTVTQENVLNWHYSMASEEGLCLVQIQNAIKRQGITAWAPEPIQPGQKEEGWKEYWLHKLKDSDVVVIFATEKYYAKLDDMKKSALKWEGDEIIKKKEANPELMVIVHDNPDTIASQLGHMLTHPKYPKDYNYRAWKKRVLNAIEKKNTVSPKWHYSMASEEGFCLFQIQNAIKRQGITAWAPEPIQPGKKEKGSSEDWLHKLKDSDVVVIFATEKYYAKLDDMKKSALKWEGDEIIKKKEANPEFMVIVHDNPNTIASQLGHMLTHPKYPKDYNYRAWKTRVLNAIEKKNKAVQAEMELEGASKKLGSSELWTALEKHKDVRFDKWAYEAEYEQRKKAERMLHDASLKPGYSALQEALNECRGIFVDTANYESEIEKRTQARSRSSFNIEQGELLLPSPPPSGITKRLLLKGGLGLVVLFVVGFSLRGIGDL